MSTATKPQGKNQEIKKRNIEIINNLKQTLGKPTIVEAQRTLKILQRLIDRIAIFSNLDTQFVIKFNELNNPQKFRLNRTLVQELSAEVLQALVRQAKMESQFRVFASLEQQLKENEPVEQEKLKQYDRVRKDMAYTFKTLIRAVEKHTQDIQIIKSLKVNSTPNAEVSNIHQALSNYKVIMQKTLATAAQEDESHTRLIVELQSRIQSLQKTRSNCDEDLKTLQEDRKEHAEQKKDQMDKLKSQIREVKSNKQRELDQIAKNSKDQKEALTKEYQKEYSNLLNLIKQEGTKLAKLREQNSKNQNKLKTDKLTSENHLSDLIQNYDGEMTKWHSARLSMQKELKKVTDELNNLKRHFLQIEQERRRQQALIQADRRRKHLWDLMEKKKGQAATKIKEAFRNWKAKNKKKKKKKK